MSRLGKEHLAAMSNEGEQVTARRERLGWDKKELAMKAGVNRNTVHAIEAGQSFNRTSLAKIERALEAEEKLSGLDAPPLPTEQHGRFIEFEVKGMYGAKSIIVKAPVEDREALMEVVERLMRGEQGKGDDDG